jgi:hypothetical protein
MQAAAGRRYVVTPQCPQRRWQLAHAEYQVLTEPPHEAWDQPHIMVNSSQHDAHLRKGPQAKINRRADH